MTINGSDNFIEPTLFGDVRLDMQLAREEIFGPVLAISAFDLEDEAIRLANDSRYGPPPAVERRPAPCAPGGAALECRNGVGEYRGRAGRRGAFGGGKQSGFGRDLSLHSFDKYTQLKTTWFQLR